MGGLKRNSIKNKLRRMGVLTGVSAILTSSFIYIFYNTYLARSHLEAELEMISKVVASRASAALNWGDQELAIQTLQDLSSKSSILTACIYDLEYAVFSYYPNSIKCPARPTRSSGWDRIVILDEIVFEKEREGYIYIESDLRDIKAALPKYVIFAISTSIFILVLIYFVASRYQKLISEPVLHLSEKMAVIVNDKNYALKATKYDNDEIGDLTELFNEMLVAIHSRDKALKSANSTLEQKVQARTADLQKALSDLQSALQVKENFISNMSHEIRTPGHAMLNMGEFARNEMRAIFDILERDPSLRPNEEIMEKLEEGLRYTGKALAAARRQAELLADVIDLKRMAEGKMSYAMKEQDFMLTAQASKKSYYEEERLITDFPTHPIMATFDSKQVKRVIDNFISNALKYAPEGDVVMSVREVECEDGAGRKQKMVQFSIKDRGVGVPPDELEHIFGKFNESSATKNKAGGKGLGLAICDEVIQAHNGKIWAENNTGGKGATFYFQLPVVG